MSERYNMCKDQPAQIDCRNIACKFHINAACTNVSPAITLMPSRSFGMNTLHMQVRCWSFEAKIEDHETDPTKPDSTVGE